MSNTHQDLFESLNPQQKQAVAMSLNGVCSAGAGAGKTYVLTLRYLSLLLANPQKPNSPSDQGLGVDQILTLTFTRKAAQEMYSRIFSTLQQVLSAKTSPNHGDPRIRKAFESFDSAQITTLDSFCRSIAVEGSSRYGIPPGFALDPKGVEALIDSQISGFLKTYHSHKVLQDYAQVFGVRNFRDSVLIPIGMELACPVPRIPSLIESFHQDLSELKILLVRLLDEIQQDGENLQAIFESRRDEKQSQGKKLSNSEVQALNGAGVLAALDYSDLEEQIKSGQIVFKELMGGKRPYDQSQGPIKSLVYDEHYVQTWDRLKENLSEIVPGILATLDKEDQGLTLATMLEDFRQTIIQQKQRRALLTYGDLLQLAIQTLLDDPELADYYRETFRAIMIDEFQDNNAQQKALLYLLAAPVGYREPRIPMAQELRPRVLFFVGDEKQSIYRFRGADVSVFKSLSHELDQTDQANQPSQISGQDKTYDKNHTQEHRNTKLSTNYRSNPQLIRWFNQLFAQVFELPPDFPPEYQNLEADFEPIDHREENPQEPQAKVEMWIQYPPLKQDPGNTITKTPIQNTSPLTANEAEFLALAQRIRRLLDDQTPIWIAREKTTRPVEPSDVGILLRSGSNQRTLERFLRMFDIPYQVQNDRSLFLDAIAADFTAFFTLLVYPEDKESWVVLARSPLLNLSNLGLAELGRNGLTAQFSDKEDQERWEYFLPLFTLAQEYARTKSPGELADLLWFQGGYRAFVLANPNSQGFMSQYEYLRQFIHLMAKEPLTRVVEELRKNLGQYEKIDELEVILPQTQGVQIMSVHGSKGLEFPVVFLADTGNIGRNTTGATMPGVMATDSQGLPRLILNFGFTVGLTQDNILYKQQKAFERAASQAELKRIFYVACTRAEQHLFFFGTYGKHNAGHLDLKNLLEGTSSTSGADSSTTEEDKRKSFLALLVDRYKDIVIKAILDDEAKSIPLDSMTSLHRIQRPTLDQWQAIQSQVYHGLPKHKLRGQTEFLGTPDHSMTLNANLKETLSRFKTYRYYPAQNLIANPSTWEEHHRRASTGYLEPEDYERFAQMVSLDDPRLVDFFLYPEAGLSKPYESGARVSSTGLVTSGEKGSEEAGERTREQEKELVSLDRELETLGSLETQAIIPQDALLYLAQMLGTLTHWFLEQIFILQLHNTPTRDSQETLDQLMEIVPRNLDNHLNALGKPNNHQHLIRTKEAIVQEAWTMTKTFFAIPQIKELITQHDLNFYPEVPFLLYHQDQWIRGTIDLVIELPQNQLRIVVDYKTDKVLDAEHYRSQVQWYLRAAKDLVLENKDEKNLGATPDNKDFIQLPHWKTQGWIAGLREGALVPIV
jgi:ATP-dependent exoDNAse (exonuclease V) beta subunit